MTTSDEATILASIRARHAAVHNGRCEDAMASLSHDIVSYDLQPPLQFTGAAARDVADLQAWLTTWSGPVSIDLTDPSVAVDHDLAIVRGLSLMRGTKRGEGPLQLWFRSTFALKRTDGVWNTFHEHHSVPMKMDGSGLAATDLRP